MDLSVFGVEVTDLAYDARAVTPGALFFCIPGKTADGHDFAAEAVERGRRRARRRAPARRLDVPQLVVPSVRAAMGPAAAEFFGRPSDTLEVAAVTGTNGKTTTAFLLHAILEAAGRRPALLTNIRAHRRRRGARRSASTRRRRSTCSACCARCSTRATVRARWRRRRSAGAQGRLAGTRFRVLVFTNLTQDHLDFHGTMEAYFDAKRALFDQADAAVVNVGDEWGRRLAAELPGAIAFSAATTISAHELRLRGRFNRENALGAVAAARALGIDDDCDPARARVRRRRARPVRVRRGGTAVQRHRRLRAHSRLARQRPPGRARARPRPPDRRLRRGRRPRPREAAADGACRRARSPTARS